MYKTAVFKAVSASIGELELPPGTRLVEAELAARFHVSKTPVREALLLLAAQDLVEVTPYHGAAVTWLSLGEWEEIIFIQDALEQPALRLVSSRISEASLATVGRHIERLKGARRAGDSRRFGKLMFDMHRILFSATGYRHLAELVPYPVGPAVRRYQKALIHQFDDAWDEELGIIIARYEGIRAKDPDGAAEAVARGHARLLELSRLRITDPLVARYIEPRR